MRRYGKWAGNPQGFLESPIHCLAEVWERSRFMHSHQCGRLRGHGPEGNYCRQHAKMLAEGRHLEVPQTDSSSPDSDN